MTLMRKFNDNKNASLPREKQSKMLEINCTTGMRKY